MEPNPADTDHAELCRLLGRAQDFLAKCGSHPREALADEDPEELARIMQQLLEAGTTAKSDTNQPR